MNTRWAPGFTVVELIIVVVVIAVLVTVSVVGYNGIHKTATIRVAQSDLDRVAADMQRAYQKTNAYPTTLPEGVTGSKNITLSVARAGEAPYYSNLSAVQNGVLLSKICQDLVNENVGKGTNQAGETVAFITGCGNWNDDSMQVTGWNSRVWSTPVAREQLLNYANNFTTSDTWNKDQERVVKNFFTQMVERQTQYGGTFPVNSFWDYWATPTNGGVMLQPLQSDPPTRAYYCVQAKANDNADIIWHITENNRIRPGAC